MSFKHQLDSHQTTLRPGCDIALLSGPPAPAGHEDRWIQTSPGAGWFVYFRIYGPEQAAFDKTWKPRLRTTDLSPSAA